MTYYEELGVADTASREEIRTAYQDLERSLDPADGQRKRLSGIADVLLDPARREEYDRSLIALIRAVSGEAAAPPRRRLDLWRLAPAAILGAVALLIVSLLLAMDRTPAGGFGSDAHLAIAPPSSEVEEAPPAGLAGDWISARDSGSNGGAGPPDSIQLSIRVADGVWYGRYRGRSPNVALWFEGGGGLEGKALRWYGTGGSQGSVTLRLLADGTLEVNWRADTPGSGLGAMSGRAVLARRPD